MYSLPQTGFVRLREIIGDKRAKPPEPGLIPVCATTFWKRVKSGEYPQPVKLSENVTAWRVEDIRDLINRLGEETAG